MRVRVGLRFSVGLGLADRALRHPRPTRDAVSLVRVRVGLVKHADPDLLR